MVRRATSAFAAARSPRSAIWRTRRRKRTIDAHGHGGGARLHRHAGTVGTDDSGRIRICRPRSSRASPPRSPAKAARSLRSMTPIIKADHVTYEHYQHHSPPGAPSREYFARLRKQGIGINLASYVGATQVRRMVLGDDNRAPDRRRAGAHESAGAARPCAMARWASPPRCSTRRRHTPRPRS